MSLKSVSTLSEICGLNSVVQHLQGLALRSVKDGPFVRQNDADNIDTVVIALQELVHECYRLHEKLETETINASILRHKLRFFPEEIRKEIQRTVDAARDLNTSELSRLQKQSVDDEAEMISLDLNLKELNKDNEFQSPECNRIRAVHDETVAILNDQMCEKAKMLIHLNETEDRIKQVDEQIVDVDEGILLLREDLIQERADARKERNRLQNEMVEAFKHLQDQQKINDVKKSETDQLCDETTEMKFKIDILKGGSSEAELSRNELEARETILCKKLENLSQVNGDLKTKTDQMSAQLSEKQRAYEKRINELQNRITELDEATVGENVRSSELKKEMDSLDIVLQEKRKIMEEDEIRVKERNAILEGHRRVLGSKSGHVAKLQQEIVGMERGLADLNQTHRALMDTLRNQVDDCRKHLAKEQQERMTYDEIFQKLEKEIDDFQKASTKTLKSNQKIIAEAKAEHEKQTQEDARLHSHVSAVKAEIAELEQELTAATDDLSQLTQTRSDQVSRLKNSVKALESQTQLVKGQIERERPEFMKLEKSFHDRREAFEQTKKDLVASKAKMKNLENEMRLTRMEIHEATMPQDVLRKELDGAQKRSFELLKDSMQRLQDIEKQVHSVDSHLSRLKMENSRFTEGNGQLEKEIRDVDQQISHSTDVTQTLEEEVKHLKEQILSIWMKENEIQEEVSRQDLLTVGEFGASLDETGKRQELVSDVTAKLQSELSLLAEFLGQLSRRRPKSTAAKEKREREISQQKSSP